MQTVKSKGDGVGKEAIPDQAFMRLRGALFFGADFAVTRNRVTFQESLEELLATAVPGRLPLSLAITRLMMLVKGNKRRQEQRLIYTRDRIHRRPSKTSSLCP